MTQSPDVPPMLVDDPAGAIEALRASGLRMSTARRLVIEALFGAPGPVSATQLSGTLRVDESSVYRNLEVLERHGLVRHLHLGHGPGLYVLIGRAEAEYLYCEGCESAIAVAPSELDPVREQIRERFGYAARFTHFAIVGLCARCAARGTPAPRTHTHAH
jgi:Fur family transcriptional regulator, ferric uptake regulator